MIKRKPANASSPGEEPNSLTPGGGGYSHTLPIRVPPNHFEAPGLERSIKNCGSLLYLLLKIVADYIMKKHLFDV